MSDDLKLAEHTVEVACALIDRLQEENKALRGEVERYREAHKGYIVLQGALERVCRELSEAKAEAARLTGGHVKSVPGEVSSLPQTPDPNPAPAMCVWVSHIAKNRSGRYSHSWVICDGTHVQYCADNVPCFVCGKPIKFA